MKVAFLLGSLSRGGTETLVLDVFRNADKANFEFFGIHRKYGPLKEDFYSTKPKFVLCSPQGKRIFSYIFRLRGILKNEGVDVVHAQQFLDAVYAHFACLGTGIKVVETFHGYDVGIKGLNRWLIHKTFGWCNAICFVSGEEMRYYLDKYGHKYADKCYVVYNGVNFDKLIPKIYNKKSPSATNANEKLKVGAVGNFVAGRQQNTLVNFLHLLDKESVDFDFYFVGRRDEKEPWRYDNCVKYCEENGLMDKVHFLGSRNDVPQLLASWDVFMYSTSHDTFGIAVVEAIATGLPTFVNDWEVMKEITEEGKLATLYKTNDPADLLRIFKDYLANKNKYEMMALENCAIIRNKFSIEQHIVRLNEVYGLVLR